jgi:hypothetical protein
MAVEQLHAAVLQRSASVVQQCLQAAASAVNRCAMPPMTPTPAVPPRRTPNQLSLLFVSTVGLPQSIASVRASMWYSQRAVVVCTQCGCLRGDATPCCGALPHRLCLTNAKAPLQTL